MLTVSRQTVARAAWGVLGYTVLVVLWGAVVRASGAGAGCGDHWPLCNGEVVPTAPALNTVIEFGHRITSGLAGIAAIGLAVVVFRGTERGHPARRASLLALFFMITEGAIGAGIVLFEQVAYNVSIGRAVWMAAHLTNTFLLLGALTLTAWYAEGQPGPRSLATRPASAVLVALGATLILGAGGAVTALGDTLVLGGGLDPETNPVVATLLLARVFHPTMAFVTLAFVALAVWMARPLGESITSHGFVLVGAFLAQMAMGALNVALQAPIWLQILHLLGTDLIWIAMVVWAARIVATPEPSGHPVLA
ncbi:COX15/CtaA family protein [Rubrivirga sp. IMCC43871]|uniref:COX15/CtaA family protein n=1 Tax=Rubrivirga sp. IMCC43871 TaxID=3391575 RepID=UPI00398F92B6